MRAIHRAVWIGVGTLFFVAAPCAGMGDELRAPPSVVAKIDGSFTYLVKFSKGPATDDLASFGWAGEENISGGLVGDCFCIAGQCTMEDGDSLTIEVVGQLTDPTQPGRVEAWVNLCMSPGQSTATTVLSYWTTAVDDGWAPRTLRLWNAPNPVSSGTTFYWEQPQPGPVRLCIYDLAGRLITTLVAEVRPAGPNQASWNARTSPAFRSAGGVYFARLSALGQTLSRTIVLLRR